jgi:hypothetical protein
VPPERHSDDEVDYLLSAGRLGGTQRDRIFNAAAEGARPQKGRAWEGSVRTRRWVARGTAITLAAAALLVIWVRASVDRDRFQVKGSKTTSLPSVDVECLHATLDACRRGSILAFAVRGAPAGSFVTAYFEPPTARIPNRRVFLLSNEPTTARVPGAIGVLARGARVPNRQDAGRYELEVLVTPRALSRDEVTRTQLGDDPVTRAQFELTVPP